MRPDVQNREDIDVLMDEFYSRALKDDLIGYIFTDVAQLDLGHHLPVIGDFWESILFRTGNYARHGRNPMQVHMALNMKEHLKPEHFERWIEIFYGVLDENFEGPNTDILKQKAAFMAQRISSVCSGAWSFGISR